MKEIYLEELMDLVVVVKLSAALVKMLNPVKTSMLNFRRKNALNSTAFGITYKYTGSVQTTDVLL